MGHYDVAQVCANGHVTNERSVESPSDNVKFCEECGAATTDICASCSVPIRGAWTTSDVIAVASNYQPPAYCAGCGAAHPWTESRLQAARALARELENLTFEERELLVSAVDDLVVDTPRTPLAQSRFKVLMKKAGSEATQAMRTIIVDVVSEVVKKSMF